MFLSLLDFFSTFIFFSPWQWSSLLVLNNCLSLRVRTCVFTLTFQRKIHLDFVLMGKGRLNTIAHKIGKFTHFEWDRLFEFRISISAITDFKSSNSHRELGSNWEEEFWFFVRDLLTFLGRLSQNKILIILEGLGFDENEVWKKNSSMDETEITKN